MRWGVLVRRFGIWPRDSAIRFNFRLVIVLGGFTKPGALGPCGSTMLKDKQRLSRTSSGEDVCNSSKVRRRALLELAALPTDTHACAAAFNLLLTQVLCLGSLGLSLCWRLRIGHPCAPLFFQSCAHKPPEWVFRQTMCNIVQSQSVNCTCTKGHFTTCPRTAVGSSDLLKELHH